MTDFNFDPDDLIIVNAKIKSRLATVSALLVFDTRSKFGSIALEASVCYRHKNRSR